MAKRQRRRRTSIRTAAGTVQSQFLERIRALRDDPIVVLPECVGPEPRQVAKARRQLERLKAGKGGLLARRDKGVVGAVVHSIALADMDSVPRLMDRKVAGKRRFFLQRRQADSECSVGVQNHDDPLVLLSAWRAAAKRHGLHFFAGPRLWCTGSRPAPPEAWWQEFAEAAGVPLMAEGDDRGCGHADRFRLRLRFAGGPSLLVCEECPSEHIHNILADRYAGPRRRRPVDVLGAAPDGTDVDLDDERVATYRGAGTAERELIRAGRAAWHARAQADGLFVLGDRVFDDLGSFLAALDAHPWELPALRLLVAGGHAGPDEGVDAVIGAHMDRFPEATAAVLGGDAGAFLSAQGHGARRDVLRRAHELARRREALAGFPAVSASGPIGAWADDVARFARTHDRRETLDRLRADMSRRTIPAHHVCAFVAALGGGDIGWAGAFTREQEETGRAWKSLAARVLECRAGEYAEALQAYLAQTGSGETAA